MQLTSLSGVVDRIQAGTSPDVALAEFADAFDLAPSDETRFAMLENEPILTKDKRLNALVGAIAEYFKSGFSESMRLHVAACLAPAVELMKTGPIMALTLAFAYFVSGKPATMAASRHWKTRSAPM